MDTGTAVLDPGIGGGRLDLFAAIEGVTGDFGDASVELDSVVTAAGGIWTAGCLGLDGRVGGGAPG